MWDTEKTSCTGRCLKTCCHKRRTSATWKLFQCWNMKVISTLLMCLRGLVLLVYLMDQVFFQVACVSLFTRDKASKVKNAVIPLLIEVSQHIFLVLFILMHFSQAMCSIGIKQILLKNYRLFRLCSLRTVSVQFTPDISPHWSLVP